MIILLTVTKILVKFCQNPGSIMTENKALKIFNLDSLEGLTSESLKSLYRKQATIKHPDKSGGSGQEFVELREAYLYLLTKIKPKKQKHTKAEDEAEEKALKELSKEEILAKYFSETKVLQEKVDSHQLVTTKQIEALETIKSQAEVVMSDFERQKQELKQELEMILEDLEKKVNPGFMKRFFLFFWPKMSEEEFWRRYNIEVNKFSRKDADLDVNFFKEMLGVYGSGLNDIANSITEL